jgi:hypothetical protein
LQGIGDETIARLQPKLTGVRAELSLCEDARGLDHYIKDMSALRAKDRYESQVTLATRMAQAYQDNMELVEKFWIYVKNDGAWRSSGSEAEFVH